VTITSAEESPRSASSESLRPFQGGWVEKEGPILCFSCGPSPGFRQDPRSGSRSPRPMGPARFRALSSAGLWRDEGRDPAAHRRTIHRLAPRQRLIHSLKKAGSANPVFLASDENIDKMADTDCPPAIRARRLCWQSLDPSRTTPSADSTTWNRPTTDLLQGDVHALRNPLQRDSAAPLQDRLRDISPHRGYTDLESFSIAKPYLFPKQKESERSSTRCRFDMFSPQGPDGSGSNRYTKGRSGVPRLEARLATASAGRWSKDVLAPGPSRGETAADCEARVHTARPAGSATARRGSGDEIGSRPGLRRPRGGRRAAPTEGDGDAAMCKPTSPGKLSATECRKTRMRRDLTSCRAGAVRPRQISSSTGHPHPRA